MWFQHDGVPAHFCADVRSALNTKYPGRWIERVGPVNWPARSPDLFCLDFFIWSHLKSFVYTSSVDSDEALVVKNDVIAGDILDMPEGYLLMFDIPSVGGVRPVSLLVDAHSSIFYDSAKNNSVYHFLRFIIQLTFIQTHNVRTSNCFFLFGAEKFLTPIMNIF
ncbi:uncharacterized protein TNCV_1698921 [Trichonephila clavipes]|nr:uncharacterized protein TNCV_1698921 [Trichonephila clavipes]